MGKAGYSSHEKFHMRFGSCKSVNQMTSFISIHSCSVFKDIKFKFNRFFVDTNLYEIKSNIMKAR